MRSSWRFAIGVAAALALSGVLLLFNAARPAGRPVLTLLVDGAPSATIGVGSPIFLEVFLHGTRGTAGSTVGGPLRSWDRLIAVRATQNGQDVALAWVRVASPRVRELTTASDGRPTFSDGEAYGAELDGLRRVFRMEVAVAPESTRALAGDYQLVASLRTPIWQFWGWRGAVQSAPVTVTVVNDVPAARQLARRAVFHYKTAQFSEAVRLAREWSTLEPASITAWTLLGDGLLATGDRDGARNAYAEALDRAGARSGKEPSSAILRRLQRLRAGDDSRRP